MASPLRLAVIVLLLTLLLPLPAHAADAVCFAATGQCLSGRFRAYWEQHGGLAVFGYPITPAQPEVNPQTSQAPLTQWFERARFEWYPENAAPFDVLLGRLGAERLQQLGVDWPTLPQASGPQADCLWFAATRHTVCDQVLGRGFKSLWTGAGRTASGHTSADSSLALFGLPLTEPRLETNTSGDTVVTQWFERARFEWHPALPDGPQVVLGLLGTDVRAGRQPLALPHPQAPAVALHPSELPPGFELDREWWDETGTIFRRHFRAPAHVDAGIFAVTSLVQVSDSAEEAQRRWQGVADLLATRPGASLELVAGVGEAAFLQREPTVSADGRAVQGLTVGFRRGPILGFVIAVAPPATDERAAVIQWASTMDGHAVRQLQATAAAAAPLAAADRRCPGHRARPVCAPSR